MTHSLYRGAHINSFSGANGGIFFQKCSSSNRCKPENIYFGNSKFHLRLRGYCPFESLSAAMIQCHWKLLLHICTRWLWDLMHSFLLADSDTNVADSFLRTDFTPLTLRSNFKVILVRGILQSMMKNNSAHYYACTFLHRTAILQSTIFIICWYFLWIDSVLDETHRRSWCCTHIRHVLRICSIFKRCQRYLWLSLKSPTTSTVLSDLHQITLQYSSSIFLW